MVSPVGAVLVDVVGLLGRAGDGCPPVARPAALPASQAAPAAARSLTRLGVILEELFPGLLGDLPAGPAFLSSFLKSSAGPPSPAG